MEAMNFHLYLLFILENTVFGINIRNIKKIHRFVAKHMNSPRMLNLKNALFQMENFSIAGNQINEFNIKIPTLIEIDIPTVDKGIVSIDIMTDFVIGLHQIPPDEFNEYSITTQQEIEDSLHVLNQDYLMGYSFFPYTGRSLKTRDIPVHLIHVEKIASYAEKSGIQ